MRSTATSDLRIDAPIFTADGRHLGVVKEIRRDAFKVDAPLARDYWLPCDVIAGADPRRVNLDVDLRQVDDLKRGEPPRDRLPDDYRAQPDYAGPDYLDAGRNWERVPREPEFSYGEWDRNEHPAARRTSWDEPHEPFYRYSNPRGYRQERRPSRFAGTSHDDDRWRMPREEFGGPARQGSRYRRPVGVESALPRYDQERGRGYQRQGGWNARFAPVGTYGQPYPTRVEGHYAGYTGLPGRGSDPFVWGESLWYDPEAPAGYSGRGPQAYRRPDDSICEEVCDRLTYAGDIDATDIDVQVRDGRVELTGEVRDRRQRRLAEDTACSVSGVRDVRNELRTPSNERGRREEPATYLV
jgi:hypothetical protein